MNGKTDLKSLTMEELTAFVTTHGFPKFRAKQIADWKERYGIVLPLSVNMSRSEMFDPELKTVKVEVGSYYTCEEWLTGICLKTHIKQYSHYTAPSNIFVHFNET